MMNVLEMEGQTEVENEESLRKKRIQMYKNVLKYYQGRSLSLDIILASKQPSGVIPPNMKNYESLQKNIRDLHDDISLLQSLKECVKLIHDTLTCTEIMSINDANLKRGIINKIEGIIYFSKSIMKLYNECYSELYILEKKKNYSRLLKKYDEHLVSLRENQKDPVNDETKSLEKVELQIYKINLIRAMKSVLLGFISINCPDLLQQFHTFMNPVRRNLTIEDFEETWDTGLVR